MLPWVLPRLAGGQTHQVMMQWAHASRPIAAGRAGNPDIRSIDLLESRGVHILCILDDLTLACAKLYLALAITA